MLFIQFKFSCLFLGASYVLQAIYYQEYINYVRKKKKYKNHQCTFRYLFTISFGLYALTMIKFLPIIIGYFVMLFFFFLSALLIYIILYVICKRKIIIEENDIKSYFYALFYFLSPIPFVFFTNTQIKPLFSPCCLTIITLVPAAFIILNILAYTIHNETYLCTFSIFSLNFNKPDIGLDYFMKFSVITFWVNIFITTTHLIVCFICCFCDCFINEKKDNRQRKYEMTTTESPL